jgi:hypothetical protein
MRIVLLQEQEMYRLADQLHNPPVIVNQKDENLFQAEVRRLYNHLIQSLALFGQEGDHYGISDFSIRPDLRDRPTVKPPPAAHIREFAITILSEEFYRSGYLTAVRDFLSSEAQNYRVVVHQDFDQKWYLTFFLTTDLAQLYCTDAVELARLEDILSKL